MIQLQTRVEVPKSKWKIEATDDILLLGSCFADEVGARMVDCGMHAMVNPLGTLYNPESIATHMLRCIDGMPYSEEDVTIFHDDLSGKWHSWMHHTRFSSEDRATLVLRMNETLSAVHEQLLHARVLIVTLGTAIIYRKKDSGMLVANCHKQPDRMFVRQCLNVEDIRTTWQRVLERLHQINPELRIIFTVSPIRHRRDGWHTNQVSKGILLQTVDMLGEDYFPSYEIVMDELRDYRFYADDLVHPSPLAVDIIWERFQETYMTEQTMEVLKKNKLELSRARHRTIST